MAKSNGGGNWIPLGVAVLAMGIFFGWLATREPPEPAVVVEPGDTTDAMADLDTGPPADTLESAQMEYSARLDELVGRTVLMQDVELTSQVGQHFRWLRLSSGDSYLLKLDSALLARAASVPASGTVDVTGTIQRKDPDVLSQWLTSGILESEAQRAEVEFGLSYIEARRVRPAVDEGN